MTRKILVVKLRALGDTALMTAPLMELFHTYPHSEIHILVSEAWAPVLKGFPGIQKIWTYQRHKEPLARARALTRLGYQLFREKYEWAINLHASPSSSLLTFATRAPVRSIHFHGHHHRNRYSTVIIPGKGSLKPIIERDMDTLRALGLTIPAGRKPILYLDDSEVQEARELIRSVGLHGPILGISLGASRPTKSWPVEHFAELAIQWTKKKKAQKEAGGVFAFAGPNEEHLIQRFMQAVREKNGKNIYATHELSLRRLMHTLSEFSVLVGNDSGPKHLAIGVGVPTVTLFGPEHPFEWHPYSSEEHPYFFIENLNCRKDADPGMPPWCGLHECITEKHQCMTRIEIAPVLEACLKVARPNSIQGGAP